ncbi:hypothetical protein C7W93_18050 [Glaciimonas sp. PCH181]|nr:hypothetical protein C7W93_18050 [Glaciimonas sp. PCH181]
MYRADRIKAIENAHLRTVFAPAEQATLSTFLPLQTDAYVAELCHFAMKMQTLSRREGSAYLRQRHVFG